MRHLRWSSACNDLGRQHASQKERHDQRAPVAVGADHHDHCQPGQPSPRRSVSPGQIKPARRRNHQQGHQLRSKKEPRTGTDHADKRQQEGNWWREPAPHADHQQQQRKGADADGAESHQRGPAADPVRDLGAHLEQPLVIDPRGLSGGEGKRVVVDEGAVLENPATAGEVPPDTGIGDLEGAEQRSGERGRQDDHC